MRRFLCGGTPTVTGVSWYRGRVTSGAYDMQVVVYGKKMSK